MNPTEGYKAMNTVEKAPVLYHASSHALEKIEPRNESIRDKDEGPVVFGTPDLAYATMFIVDTDDRWTHKGGFGDVYYMVISDEKRFRKSDGGGYVYELPSDNFSSDQNKSMGSKEYTSLKGVVPNSFKHFESGLQAMIDNGVQVYFVDQNTFDAIDESKDHGWQILKNIESENQKQRRNVIGI